MHSHPRLSLVLVVVLSSALPAAAQQSILFNMDHSGHYTNGGAGIALLHLNDQDINIVTPAATGSYYARKFFNVAAWRCAVGDTTNNFSYANGFAVSEVDTIQVAPGTNTAGGVHLSDLWISFNNNVQVLPSSGVSLIEEGDVVQFLPGGAIVKKITKAQINVLINQPPGSACDVDGLAIDATGDFYYSDSQTVGPAQDGAMWMAPAGTWDTAGFAQASGAWLILVESEVSAMVSNATGGMFASVGDLKGIEIDPNGGTWTATRRKVVNNVVMTIDTAQLPNLIFGAGNVGGTLFSTANGGSVAVINGVSIGGPPWNNAALGPAMGVQASSAVPTLGDFALIPQQAPPLLSDYTYTTVSGADPLGNTPTPGTFALDLGDTAPFGLVNLVVSTEFGWSSTPSGQRFPSVPLAGYDFNDLYFPDLADPLVQLSFLQPAFAFATDANGVVNVTIAVPAGLSGFAVVVQPIDIGALRLGGPAPVFFQ